MKNKNFLYNINRKTELLESIDWDEEKLNELYEYLNIHFAGDSITSPKLLLNEVKKNYGDECAKVLRKMFIEISLTHGLFVYDPSVEN